MGVLVTLLAECMAHIRFKGNRYVPMLGEELSLSVLWFSEPTNTESLVYLRAEKPRESNMLEFRLYYE